MRPAAAIMLAVLALSLRHAPARAQPPETWLFRLQMFDPQTGWAVSSQGYSGIGARGAVDSVLRTTDGGLNWRDVTPPAPPGLKLRPIYAFYALNSLIAWVSAAPDPNLNPPILFRTVDGGQTWRYAKLPVGSGTAPPVYFINPRDGWRLIHNGDIHRSRDGGATWFKIGSTTSRPREEGVTFLNTESGWIAGWSDPPDGVYYFVTRDGGRTWQKQRFIMPPQVMQLTPRLQRLYVLAHLPKFFTTKDGILPVSYRGSDTDEDAGVVFYVTRDGGAAWTSTPPVTERQGYCCIWSFSDVNHGWVMDRNALYMTDDSGRRWTEVQTNLPVADVGLLHFISPKIGWATSGLFQSPLLLKTVDGGRTWTHLAYTIVRK